MKRLFNENINTKEYWSNRYAKKDYDLGVDKILHSMIANQIMDNSSVIDYGCGPAEILKKIKRRTKNCLLMGVDQSPVKCSVMIVEGDVYTPMDDCATYTISTEVIEHVDDPQKAVDCLYNSMEKGGMTILTTPILNRVPSPEHVWNFNLKDIEALFWEYSQVFIFPYASGGWGQDGERIYPPGTPNIFLVKAIK